MICRKEEDYSPQKRLKQSANLTPVGLVAMTIYPLGNTITSMFNDALQNNEPPDIGKWLLILIQKQGKPAGPLAIVQPILLMYVLSKTLYLIFPWSRKSMDRSLLVFVIIGIQKRTQHGRGDFL